MLMLWRPSSRTYRETPPQLHTAGALVKASLTRCHCSGWTTAWGINTAPNPCTVTFKGAFQICCRDGLLARTRPWSGSRFQVSCSGRPGGRRCLATGRPPPCGRQCSGGTMEPGQHSAKYFNPEHDLVGVSMLPEGLPPALGGRIALRAAACGWRPPSCQEDMLSGNVGRSCCRCKRLMGAGAQKRQLKALAVRKAAGTPLE